MLAVTVSSYLVVQQACCSSGNGPDGRSLPSAREAADCCAARGASRHDTYRRGSRSIVIATITSVVAITGPVVVTGVSLIAAVYPLVARVRTAPIIGRVDRVALVAFYSAATLSCGRDTSNRQDPEANNYQKVFHC
jgi:hypothetical protein